MDIVQAIPSADAFILTKDIREHGVPAYAQPPPVSGC